MSVAHGRRRVVSSVDLTVGEGETLALLGPSGSGKTTLMYAIAGFLDLEEGAIEIDDVVVSRPGNLVPPERRSIGMVFQNYALWPHMTAAENVAYPIRRSGTSRSIALARANDLMELVGIGGLGGRTPSQLSGGEQQRVGLARALARSGRLLLLDEPTAHLDAPLRAAVQEEITRRRVETGACAVYATHDAAEALAIADRVAIIRDGSIVQQGTAIEIYERPVDVWAARLTGPASLVSVSDQGRFGRPTVIDGVGDVMIVRPEWVVPGGALTGRVVECWYRGSHTDLRIATPLGVLQTRLPGPPTLEVGVESEWTIRRGWLTNS